MTTNIHKNQLLFLTQDCFSFYLAEIKVRNVSMTAINFLSHFLGALSNDGVFDDLKRAEWKSGTDCSHNFVCEVVHSIE